MRTITLSMYSIDFENSEGEIPVNKITKNSMCEELSDFLDFLKSDFENNRDTQKVLTVDEFNIEEIFDEEFNECLYDCIVGKFQSGEYGIESDIIDTRTRETMLHKKIEHADVLPFYFAFGIPRGESTKLLLILQGVGNYKIKTVFFDSFKKYFKKELGIGRHTVVNLKPLVPSEFVDKLLSEAQFNKIRLINYKIPSDISDKFGVNGGVMEEDSGYMETVIVRRKNGISKTINKAARMIFESYSVNSKIISLSEELDYDDFKVELEIGGRHKIVKASNFQNLSFGTDITEDVVLVGGHPTKESIGPILKQQLNEYFELLGILG